MGDKFPKHIYHSIICIGALVAHCDNGHWQVDALGAPHIGERSEKELIISFVSRIATAARADLYKIVCPHGSARHPDLP